jgi:hypothetical protein
MELLPEKYLLLEIIVDKHDQHNLISIKVTIRLIGEGEISSNTVELIMNAVPHWMAREKAGVAAVSSH